MVMYETNKKNMKETEEKFIIRYKPKSAEEKRALLNLKKIQDIFTSKEFVDKLLHWRKHERPKWIAIKDAEKVIHTFLHTPISSHNITHNDVLKALETIGKANRDIGYNPKKANPDTARRNQEISDRLYDAGYHTQDKPLKGTWKQIFQEIAAGYPTISWQMVQKIAKNKTIIPTQLQTSNK